MKKNRFVTTLLIIIAHTSLCTQDEMRAFIAELKDFKHIFQASDQETKESLAKEIIESAKLMGASIGTAISCGILPAEVAAHLCKKYFNEDLGRIWNPNFTMRLLYPNPSFQNSPLFVGLGKGFVGAWWIGMLFSVFTTLAARTGPWPKLTVSDLKKSMLYSLGGIGLSSFAGGIIGYLWPDKFKGFCLSHVVLDSNQQPYIANAVAQRVAYWSSATTGLGILGWTLYKRYKLHKQQQELKNIDNNAVIEHVLAGK